MALNIIVKNLSNNNGIMNQKDIHPFKKMKKIMKLIYNSLYLMYNVLLFVIAGILLVSVIIIAITNSWLYLFLYIPISLFFYETKIFHYKKKQKNR
jgi:hypothetical protein